MKLLNITAFTILACSGFTNTQSQDFNSFLYHYRITKDFLHNHERYDQDMKRFYDSYNQLSTITKQESALPFKSELIWYVHKTVNNYLKIISPVYELVDQALQNPEWNKNHHYWLTIRFGISSIIKRHEKEIIESLRKADSLLNSYMQMIY